MSHSNESGAHPQGSRPEKRARILEAALRVCERSGVEGARMEEVAALARVSKGTLYHFFESKQDLFLATMIDSYEESLRIADTPAEAASDLDPRVRFDRILDGLTKVLAANAPRINVHYQAWGLIAGSPEAQERLFGFLRAFFDERSRDIAQVIRDGQAQGVFSAGADVQPVTDGIIAVLSGFIYRSAFDSAYADPVRLRASLNQLACAALGIEDRHG